jgi:hypothetical protein
MNSRDSKYPTSSNSGSNTNLPLKRADSNLYVPSNNKSNTSINSNTSNQRNTNLPLKREDSNLYVPSNNKSNTSINSNTSNQSNTSTASNSYPKYGPNFSTNNKCKSNFYKIEIDYSKGAIHYDVEILFVYKNKNNDEKEAKAKKEYLK